MVRKDIADHECSSAQDVDTWREPDGDMQALRASTRPRLQLDSDVRLHALHNTMYA